MNLSFKPVTQILLEAEYKQNADFLTIHFYKLVAKRNKKNNEIFA